MAKNNFDFRLKPTAYKINLFAQKSRNQLILSAGKKIA